MKEFCNNAPFYDNIVFFLSFFFLLFGDFEAKRRFGCFTFLPCCAFKLNENNSHKRSRKVEAKRKSDLVERTHELQWGDKDHHHRWFAAWREGEVAFFSISRCLGITWMRTKTIDERTDFDFQSSVINSWRHASTRKRSGTTKKNSIEQAIIPHSFLREENFEESWSFVFYRKTLM